MLLSDTRRIVPDIRACSTGQVESMTIALSGEVNSYVAIRFEKLTATAWRL